MNAVNTVLESVRNLVESFLATLPQIVIAILVIFFAWFIVQILHKLWHKIAGRFKIRPNLEELFRKFIFMTVWVVGILIAAMTVFPDFTPSKLLTVIGLGSIAIGFAFKEIFENQTNKLSSSLLMSSSIFNFYFIDLIY